MSDFFYNFGVIALYAVTFLGAVGLVGVGIALSIEEGGKRYPAMVAGGVLLLCIFLAAAASGLVTR